MNKVKVGIIGSGFIANHHCYAYSLLPNVEMIGIASNNKEEAKSLMNKYDIADNFFDNYKDLLKLDCDAISMCVPNNLHKEIACDVLNSGKHALVEKPLARNIREASEMLDVEASSNRTTRPHLARLKRSLKKALSVGYIWGGEKNNILGLILDGFTNLKNLEVVRY